MIKDGVVYLSHGQAIAYRESQQQEKAKVVVFNGHMADDSFLPLLEEYLLDDYHLLIVDLPGCGQSPYMRSFDSFAQLAVDLKEVLERLDFTESYLMGWFFGGAVAIELSTLLAEIKGCILLGSFGLRGYGWYKNRMALQHFSMEAMGFLSEELVKELSLIYEEHESKWLEIWSQEGRKHTPMAKAFSRSWYDYQEAMLRFNASTVFNGLVAGSGRLEAMHCPLLVLEQQSAFDQHEFQRELGNDPFFGKKVCLLDSASQKEGLRAVIAHFVE